MKYAILLLPTLLEIAVIVLPARTHTISPLTRDQRDAEIRELRAEQKSIGARLKELQSQSLEFLPRGMGR